MDYVDVNLTVNAGLIVFLLTYLLVNGFLVFLLFRLRSALSVFLYSREHGVTSSGIRELSELKASISEIHRVSAQELNEINELKQSLFDIQNTAARQLNEISKLKQSIIDISSDATSSARALTRG